MLSRHQFRNLRHSSFPSKRVGTPSDPFTLLSHACFRLSLQDRLRLAFDRALFQSEGLGFGVGGGGGPPLYLHTWSQFRSRFSCVDGEIRVPRVLFLVSEPPGEVIDLYTHASRSSSTKTIHSTATLIPPATQARCRSEIKFHLEPCTISLIVFFFVLFFFSHVIKGKTKYDTNKGISEFVRPSTSDPLPNPWEYFLPVISLFWQMHPYVRDY